MVSPPNEMEESSRSIRLSRKRSTLSVKHPGSRRRAHPDRSHQRYPTGNFDLADAYAVSAAITRRRKARGEQPVGWKIGFTNSSIWAEQGLSAPIWAPMYDTTVAGGTGEATLSIGGLLEPRIEPEIALRIAQAPHPDMDEAELLACVDAVTHGFEIVQSLYPGWRLKPAGRSRRLWDAWRLSSRAAGTDPGGGSRALAKNAGRFHRRPPSRRCGDGSRLRTERARRAALRAPPFRPRRRRYADDLR